MTDKMSQKIWLKILWSVNHHPWQKQVTLSLTAGLLVILGAAAFALLKPVRWEAVQPLVLRIDAGWEPGTDTPRDQLRRNLHDMAVAVFQSRNVLTQVLKDVGPERRRPARGFPTPRDVEQLRDVIKITPPSTSEFGTTDVIYLKVRAGTPGRAKALTESLVRHAETEFSRLLAQKAQNAVEELSQAEHAALANLHRDLAELQQIEQSLGLDAVTLRTLEERPDDRALRASLDELDAQIQQCQRQQLEFQKMLEVLRQLAEQPARLASVPTDLLETHPALLRLQEALTEAEVKLITLQGEYGDDHPSLIAARVAVEELRRRVAEEVPATINTVQTELGLLETRLDYLEAQRAEEAARLGKVLEAWPRYRLLSAQIGSQKDNLESLRRRLQEARTAQAAIGRSPILVPIEPVQTGARPVGPGRLTIVLAGITCGLVLAGAVFLWLVPMAHQDSQLTQAVPAGHQSSESIPTVPKAFTADSTLEPPPATSRSKTMPAPLMPVAPCPRASPLHQALLRSYEPLLPMGEAVYER